MFDRHLIDAFAAAVSVAEVSDLSVAVHHLSVYTGMALLRDADLFGHIGRPDLQLLGAAIRYGTTQNILPDRLMSRPGAFSNFIGCVLSSDRRWPVGFDRKGFVERRCDGRPSEGAGRLCAGPSASGAHRKVEITGKPAPTVAS